MKLYDELLKLAPKEYPVVSVFNKKLNKYEDKTVYRKYMSYGVSPEFKETGKSYMFNNQSRDMPEILEKLLRDVQILHPELNNVYVNWYKDGTEYIEPHSDCTANLLKGSKILILNLNEGDYCRTFKMQHKINADDYRETPLKNGTLITLDAKEQTKYRHWIDKEDTLEGRISITFRAVKEQV